MTYELPSPSGLAMLQGWHVNRIFTAQGGTPIFFYDRFDDISGTGEFNDHWNITGDPSNIHWSKTVPIPLMDPGTFTTDTNGHLISGNTQCIASAGGQAAIDQLAEFGVLCPGKNSYYATAAGTFGNMRRNMSPQPEKIWGFFHLSKSSGAIFHRICTD